MTFLPIQFWYPCISCSAPQLDNNDCWPGGVGGGEVLLPTNASIKHDDLWDYTAYSFGDRTTSGLADAGIDQGTWKPSQRTRQDKKTRRWMIWILLLVSDFLHKHSECWINILAWRILSYLCKQISHPSLQILSERGSWWLWIPPNWPWFH